MNDACDIEHLRQWIGKTARVTGVLTPELLTRYRATLGDDLDLGGKQPLGLQWCLGMAAEPRGNLGRDGHPKLGSFLPDVPNARRMWAGGRLAFHHDPPIGVEITRASEIADITLKQNARGELVFVAVNHRYLAENEVLIEETHNIVYRAAGPFKAARPEPMPSAIHRSRVIPDTTMLFRYSAITFNGHRIHYDREYAQKVEGYPDLVFHGPLTSVFLQTLAQNARSDARLVGFDYRGVAPAFVNQGLHFLGLDTDCTKLEARNDDGALIMKATATFE